MSKYNRCTIIVCGSVAVCALRSEAIRLTCYLPLILCPAKRRRGISSVRPYSCIEGISTLSCPILPYPKSAALTEPAGNSCCHPVFPNNLTFLFLHWYILSYFMCTLNPAEKKSSFKTQETNPQQKMKPILSWRSLLSLYSENTISPLYIQTFKLRNPNLIHMLSRQQLCKVMRAQSQNCLLHLK